jgi:hypothetical protein
VNRPSGPISPSVWRDLNGRTDEELIAALASGYDDAITALFDRYSRLVFRVAERSLRNPEEAEEVLQTVFFMIFRMAAKFEPERGSAKIWLAWGPSIRRPNEPKHKRFLNSSPSSPVSQPFQLQAGTF